MPHGMSPTLAILSVRITRTLHTQLRAEAKRRGATLTQLFGAAVRAAVLHALEESRHEPAQTHPVQPRPDRAA